MSREIKGGVDATLCQEITCPYCGASITDSWEVDFGPGLDGDTEFQCNESNCEKRFEVTRVTDVRYTSRIMPEPTKTEAKP